MWEVPLAWGSLVWATGYSYDFGWIDLPLTSAGGIPVQQRGVTAYPGLYFLGLRWQYKLKSAFIYGVGEDAAYLAEVIAATSRPSSETTVV